MEEKIKKILHDIGISRTTIGYKFWLDIIEKAYTAEPKGEIRKLKIYDYYEYLTLKHNWTKYGVERGLRYSIENKQEEIQDYFIYYDEKITNKRFLILCVEKLNER